MGFGIAALLIAGAAVSWASHSQEPASSTPAAPSASPAATRLATCDIYKIAEKLMKQEKYSGPLQASRQDAEKKLGPMLNELQALRDKIEAAGNPQNSREDILSFQQKQQAFQQAQQQLERDIDRLAAQTNNSAFVAVVEAAQVVANAKGYTHVFSTRPVDVGAGPETQLQFTLGILAKPVVVYPKDDDITQAVMAEMKVD
jgi:Skp family chaperone for outer membrane proteins